MCEPIYVPAMWGIYLTHTHTPAIIKWREWEPEEKRGGETQTEEVRERQGEGAGRGWRDLCIICLLSDPAESQALILSLASNQSGREREREKEPETRTPRTVSSALTPGLVLFTKVATIQIPVVWTSDGSWRIYEPALVSTVPSRVQIV